MVYHTVYRITNIENGMIYVGKHTTRNLEDGYMGSGKRLQRAIERHGRESFRKEILFVFDTEDAMNAKEAEIVNKDFIQRNDTYNLCEGGYGSFRYINENGLNKPYINKDNAVDLAKRSHERRKNNGPVVQR